MFQPRHPANSDPLRPFHALNRDKKDCACAMDKTEMAAIADRLTRIEALLLRLLPKADRMDGDLAAALGDLTAGEWFTAAEAWRAVEALRRAVEATGEPAPFIVQAFDDLGLTSSRSLGRWLAGLGPSLIERADKTRDGVLWRIL